MKHRVKLLFTMPENAPAFKIIWSSEAAALAERLNFRLDTLAASPGSPAEWNRLCREYDGLITSWGSPCLNAEILAGNRSLRIVGHAGGSVADLVSPALYERGVTVLSANDVMARNVAEWCLAATLLSFNRAPAYWGIGDAVPMRWQEQNRTRSIRDAVIGVWGYGAIARHYIDYLAPLRPAKILVASEHASSGELERNELVPASLEEVFSSADVILPLAGLNARNFERVGASLLAGIRDGASLVNFGRARLIEEKALLEELAKNRFTAWFDVFYQEPLPESSPFNRFPNVILTPHVGGIGCSRHFLPYLLEQFDCFFNGGTVSGTVSSNRAAVMTCHSKA